jgi:hypothetical protein
VLLMLWGRHRFQARRAPDTTVLVRIDCQAHPAAIQRMAYLFAAVEDTEAFVGKVRALQPAAG